MKICQACENRFNREDWTCPSCGSRPQINNGFFIFAPESDHVDTGFRPEVFEQIFQLEANNFWFKVRNQLITWALDKYFPNMTSFLEIGCGTGFVLEEIQSSFPEISLSGSEIHTEALKLADTRTKGRVLLQMDARNIPFENEFDVIGAFDVLEHIEQDQQVLKQMYEAVRQDGGIVLTVPQHRFLWGPADEFASHERRYNLGELRTKVEEAGFTVIRITSFVSLLFPVMLLSRWRFRISKKTYDPVAELNINPVLNWIFEGFLRTDATLIRLGVSLPFGGSLLLIAHKRKHQ